MDIRRSIINALGGGDGSPPGIAQSFAATVPAGTIYYVPSGDVWGVLALTVEAGAELRIDGEVHAWGRCYRRRRHNRWGGIKTTLEEVNMPELWLSDTRRIRVVAGSRWWSIMMSEPIRGYRRRSP